MDFNEADTVTVAIPETLESVAVIVLVPPLIALTDPLEETVAIAVADEDHAADELTSLVVLSL